jgi:protein phosphatase
VASRLAADVFADVLLGQRPDGDVDHVAQTLLHAVGRANRRILDYALANPKSRGMGTTITAAVAMGPELVLAQVGDSRAYLRRGRALQQLTVDHSIVGQMLESGEITPEQARSADQRNVLLQALGVQEQVQPDVVRVSLLAGDVLLLCSDGLSGVLDDAAILELLMRHPDPLRCCRALTEAACAKGGPDNVSVAVARFVGDGLPVPLGRQPIQFRRDRAMVA